MEVNFRLSVKSIWITFIFVSVVLLFSVYLAYKNVIGVSDCGIIFATLLGPVFAVQIQSFKDAVNQDKDNKDKERKEILNIRRGVFRQLMAYRANPVDNYFVQALNVVPVDFQGVIEVENAYNAYIKQLGISPAENQSAWDEQCNDKRAFMLQEIAKSLGYNFNIDDIKRNRYISQGMVNKLVMQEQIIEKVHEILNNKALLPVMSFNVDSAPKPDGSACSEKLSV